MLVLLFRLFCMFAIAVGLIWIWGYPKPGRRDVLITQGRRAFFLKVFLNKSRCCRRHLVEVKSLVIEFAVLGLYR